MKPQRFFGATSREVLRKVKQALGEDALIVTNRATDSGGIEITALAGVGARRSKPAFAGDRRPRRQRPAPAPRGPARRQILRRSNAPGPAGRRCRRGRHRAAADGAS